METQAFIQSRTVIWLLTALVAKLANLAIAHWGLPVPADVQAEAVSLAQSGLDVLTVGAIALGMWFRKQAAAVIDRWF